MLRLVDRCRLGDKVSRPSRGGARLFSSGLFLWQGTDGEMQADGKETVKYVCSSLRTAVCKSTCRRLLGGRVRQKERDQSARGSIG